MEGLEKQTKTLAQEYDHLRGDSAKIKKVISELRSPIDDQAQHTRHKCFEIRGSPMTSGEDINTIWRETGALVEVEINDTDISISHRIPSSNNGELESRPISHPAIVFKFTNRRIWDSFYKARTKSKSYIISDVGLGHFGESNIFIQESLTEAERKLFKNCLKFHKDQNFKFIWVHLFSLQL